METKRCSGCKEQKPIERFGHYNSYYCKDCLASRQREYQHWKRVEKFRVEPPQPKPILVEKNCTMCGEKKPVEEFNFLNRELGRRSSYCRPCQSKRAMLDRERRGKEEESLRYKCSKVGVDPEWFKAKLEEQDGVCAICQQPESHLIFSGSERVRSLAIDHDHESGKFRGLLCFRCNTSIHLIDKYGYGWATRAVDYLKKYKGDSNGDIPDSPSV